jgi:hypothetical protein
MIKDSSKIQLEAKTPTRASVTLEETQVSDSKIVIYGLPHNAIAAKIDTFTSPDTILAGTRGECKRADYVILSDDNDKKLILYIEIKLKRKEEKHLIEQLKGAVCFIGFCKEVAKQFWYNPTFLSDFDCRFVVFTHTGSIRKRSTRIDKDHQKNDTPEKALKISYTQKYEFSQLVGR